MMKVSELTGAQLDYWVAKAERGDTETLSDFEFWKRECWEVGVDRFSSNWAQGGPLIERERIASYFDYFPHDPRLGGGYGPECHVWRAGFNLDPRYHAYTGPTVELEHEQFGPALLVAAMRARVASKFGEEVPGA